MPIRIKPTKLPNRINASISGSPFAFFNQIEAHDPSVALVTEHEFSTTKTRVSNPPIGIGM